MTPDPAPSHPDAPERVTASTAVSADTQHVASAYENHGHENVVGSSTRNNSRIDSIPAPVGMTTTLKHQGGAIRLLTQPDSRSAIGTGCS